MKRCPKCGAEAEKKDAVGDLLTCPGCAAPFWAVDGLETGVPVAPPERTPPSSAAVLGLHLGVLAAEVVLALAVAGLLVGVPVWALARLLGAS